LWCKVYRKKMYYVVKRSGQMEKVIFDKITSRIEKLCFGLNMKYVNPIRIAQRVIDGLYNGIKTSELDTLAAETAAALTTEHYDYGVLAARIAISNLHKMTKKSFSHTINDLYNYIDPKTNEASPLIMKEVCQFVQENAAVLDSSIVFQRDFNYDYFGFKTLERSYLFKINGHVVERPQHLLMRVAAGIHCGDIEACIETYELMSLGYFIHASPTLFNAGTPFPQLSSCFLLQVKADSIEGIFDTLKDIAQISKRSGGIGVAFHKVRAAGSYIRGTHGESTGIVPFLRVYNNTGVAVNQGSRRKGAIAVYLEPWHADIFEFLDLGKKHGAEELRARDLFYAVWVCDLFMKRVEQDANWSLFCPNECPGLPETYGAEFERLYEEYESKQMARKTVRAQELWSAILQSQIETGTPYLMQKDACNRKSNQKNLGTIQSSNLCCEIVEYTSPDEIAVCNLANVCLPKFIVDGEFNHQKLFEVTKVVTRNLNKIIDVNFYPVIEAERSNKRHRPIGIGVQGLADTFAMLRMPFDSVEARKLNKEIFETMYFAALTASNELAEREKPYITFQGSPASEGILQHDMWNVKPDSGRWDWDGLKEKIKTTGLRNSLLLAPMPTASTSNILGFNECVEAFTNNLYTRSVLAGDYIIVNKHLLKDLINLGLWNADVKNKLMAANGSVQNIDEIPADIKAIYRTSYEIPQKSILEMAADRGAYICQSQSLNIHMANPSIKKLSALHFKAWRLGLKCSSYYIRTAAAANAIQFTVSKPKVDNQREESTGESPIGAKVCSRIKNGECFGCQ
jgi:ribonucleoside-diphosphate reductase alpha chain